MTDIYDPKTIDPHHSIGPLLNRTRLALGAAVDEAFLRDKEVAPFEVTSAQFAILAALYNGLASSAGELCKSMQYDRGAMSRMLDRLEAKGLIRRVRRPGERRTIGLEITAQGKAAFPKMRACVVAVVNRFLRGISKSEVRQVERVLQRMLANG